MNLSGTMQILVDYIPWWQRFILRRQPKKWRVVRYKGHEYFQRTEKSWWAEGGHSFFMVAADEQEKP